VAAVGVFFAVASRCSSAQTSFASRLIVATPFSAFDTGQFCLATQPLLEGRLIDPRHFTARHEFDLGDRGGTVYHLKRGRARSRRAPRRARLFEP